MCLREFLEKILKVFPFPFIPVTSNEPISLPKVLNQNDKQKLFTSKLLLMVKTRLAVTEPELELG